MSSSYSVYGLPSPVSPTLEDSPNPFLAAFKAEIAPDVLTLTLSPPPLIRQLEEQAEDLSAGLYPPWSSRAPVPVVGGNGRPDLRLTVCVSPAVRHGPSHQSETQTLWSPVRAISPAIATSSLSAFDAGLEAGIPSTGLGLSFGSPPDIVCPQASNTLLEDYLVDQYKLDDEGSNPNMLPRWGSAPPNERSTVSPGLKDAYVAAYARSNGRRASHGHSRSLDGTSTVDESALVPEKVTPFVWKLVKLLDQNQYAPWIMWDDSGRYVLVAVGQDRLRAILSLFFRHTSLKSFIRQLHIYGFRRVPQGQLATMLDEHNVIRLGEGVEELRHAEYAAFRHPDFCQLPGGREHERKQLACLRPNAPPTRISPIQRSTRSRPT